MGAGRGGSVSLIASAPDQPLDRAAGGRVHLSRNAARQTGEASSVDGELHRLGHGNGLPRAGDGGDACFLTMNKGKYHGDDA